MIAYLQDEKDCTEIESWVSAAKAAAAMRNNRLGLLSHYYGGMIEVYSDLTKHSATFVSHIEMLEIYELKRHRDEVSNVEIKNRIKEFNIAFEISRECEDSEIERAAKTSVALDKLVKNHNFSGMTYY